MSQPFCETLIFIGMVFAVILAMFAIPICGKVVEQSATLKAIKRYRKRQK